MRDLEQLFLAAQQSLDALLMAFRHAGSADAGERVRAASSALDHAWAEHLRFAPPPPRKGVIP